MSNELRLLKAFIEAMGYEVENKATFYDKNDWIPKETDEGIFPSNLFVSYDYIVKKKQRAKREKRDSHCYDPDFEEAWKLYPKRAGSNPKNKAYCSWTNNISNIDILEMLNGTKRYKAFCDATGKTGTEYVMQAAKFFGRDKHYLEPWTLPVGHNKLALPRLDDQLEAWAIKNGLPRPKPGESYAEYRRRLTELINH